jgi:hypothetical protein
MKPCLDNYILLRNTCSDAIPASGLWLDNLEGMSVENVAMVAPENLNTAAKVVAEKLQFAALIVENRLRGTIEERGVNLNRKGKTYNTCDVTASTVAPFPAEKGIKISKKWLGSTLSVIRVHSIFVKGAATGATTIKISDIWGNVLWSKQLTLVAGERISLKVNQQFVQDTILITADTTNVGLYTWHCSEQSNCRPCMHKKQYLVVEGWNGFGYSQEGYLGACVSLDCSDKDIICHFLDRLGLAILHQLGVEMLKEWASPNNRLNIIKTHGEDWANAKQADWEKYSIEYMMNEMNNILAELQEDKHCYACEGRFRAFPMLP